VAAAVVAAAAAAGVGVGGGGVAAAVEGGAVERRRSFAKSIQEQAQDPESFFLGCRRHPIQSVFPLLDLQIILCNPGYLGQLTHHIMVVSADSEPGFKWLDKNKHLEFSLIVLISSSRKKQAQRKKRTNTKRSM